jgi:hypothetical protein
MPEPFDRRVEDAMRTADHVAPDTGAALARFAEQRRRRAHRQRAAVAVLATGVVVTVVLALVAVNVDRTTRLRTAATVTTLRNAPEGGRPATTSSTATAGATAPNRRTSGTVDATATTTTTTAAAGSANAAPSNTAGPRPPPTTTPPPSPGANVVVTDADDGKTFSLRVGQYLDVRLSGGMSWSEPQSSDQQVLPRLSASQASDGSAQGRFRAVAKGQADVSATQSAPCATSTPRCMVPSRLWRVTIVVSE